MIQEQFAGAAAALYFIKLKDPEDPYCDIRWTIASHLNNYLLLLVSLVFFIFLFAWNADEMRNTNPRNQPNEGEYSNVDFKANPPETLVTESNINTTVQFIFFNINTPL
jgi:hypothetical protein